MSEEAKEKETSQQKAIDEQSADEKPQKVVEETKAEKKGIIRIPWKEFLRSQFGKLLGTIFILALMVWIINLSAEITPDRDEVNPSDIISSDEFVNLQLMAITTIVFILVIGFFSKIVFFDHKEDFGIESYKSIKAVLFFLLTITFISLVFVLLDVALINIYLQSFPVYFIWGLRSEFNLDLPFIDSIPVGTDRIAYAEIRGYLFLILFAFMLSFPLAMTIVILTRFGRSQLQERKNKPRKKYSFKDWMKFLATLPLEFILISLFFAIDSVDPEIPAQFLFLLIFILVGLWWITQLIILILRGIRVSSFVIYSNAAMAIPIVFLFYILPGLVWATWDMFVIFTTNEIANTVYADLVGATPNIDPSTTDIRTISSQKVLEFYFQTFVLNLGDLFRIIELDFVFIIGLSSVVIGFAEGYSIIAIIRSITTGVSIARSGRIATKSSPKMIVLSSRLVLLGAWLGLLYDKFIVLWNTLQIELGVDIPDLTIPRLFEYLFGVTIDLQNLGGFFLILSVLVVPLYFIITSSFKFLSVSIVAEKTKEDTQAFFFLISSAFILIISQIFADISALPEFLTDGEHYDFLPLQGVNIPSTFIPFISKVFESLEAIGFYVGAIVSFFILFKLGILKIFGR
ncbi:MAG: hypothetical protein HeimC2_40720 [Candidatus Heimdallarchaeota archaeon LC_2]|nr:MAG: hypothetical protein HeimC2_40720 [Candidatus Heimdallarchaeota archaeon LC_2]